MHLFLVVLRDDPTFGKSPNEKLGMTHERDVSPEVYGGERASLRLHAM